MKASYLTTFLTTFFTTLFLTTFKIFAIVSLASTQAWAGFQFVDCARIDNPERVILNIYEGQTSGTFFASAGISDDPEPRTEVLSLSVQSETNDLVTFSAQDEQSVFMVEFPKKELKRSSKSFAVQIGSRLKNESYVNQNTFACFSVLY